MKALLPLVTAVVIFTGASLFAGNTFEYWITPNGTADISTNPPEGSAANPWVTPNEADFDSIMRWIPPGSTIHLMAGTFVTTNIIPKENWKIRGAGIDVTTVEMSSSPPSAASSAAFPVIGNIDCDLEPGVEVSDLTVNCTLPSGTCIEAVTLQGSETRISRVKAINWGSDNGQQCHVLNISNQCSASIISNCVIDSCIIGPPGGTQDHGSEGITILGAATSTSLASGWIVGAEIRNCVVSQIPNTEYFRSFDIGTVLGGKITGNQVLNLASDSSSWCFYEGCSSVSNLVVENNLFLNVANGIGFASSGSCSGSYKKENILIRNNVITILDSGLGMSLSDLTNAVVTGNFVQAAQTGSSTAGVQFFSTENIFFDDNIIDLKGIGEQFYYDNTDTCSSIGNNTDINGNPIGSQETWPTLHRWSAELPIEYAGNLNGLTGGTAPDPEVYDAAHSSGAGAATAWNTVPHGLGFSNIVSEIDVEGNTGIPATTVEVQLATFTGNLTLVSAVSFTNTVSAGGITTFTLTNALGWTSDSGPRQVRALLMNPSTQAAPANEVWLVGWTIRSVE